MYEPGVSPRLYGADAPRLLGVMRVPFRRLRPEAREPERAHEADAGYDLRSVEEMSLPPGVRALVRTGISVAIPKGYAGLVLPRSGLAMRHGIAPVNTPGLIDSG